MINHAKKCIFVHIIKTGGMSVATALDMQEKQCHLSSQQIIDEIGVDMWNQYFTFTFVRNPWDKVVSQYHYNGEKWCKKYFGKKISFEKYVVDIIGVDKQYTMHEPQNLPYIVNNVGKVNVDFVGRFEQLQQDFNHICDLLNMQEIQLPKINKSKHLHYTQYYNENTKNIIADKFAADIAYFKYHF